MKYILTPTMPSKLIIVKCNQCELEFFAFLVNSDKCPSLICPKGILCEIEE